MDLFKLFPPLLLDLLSKFVPGSVFLLAFQNRYLPPTEMVLQLFEPLTEEFRSWGSVGIFVVSSYLIGIFIALASNAVDGWAAKAIWQPRLKSAPADYLFSDDQPSSFIPSVASPKVFGRFLDYCRTVVHTSNPSIAFMLEKYRTVYRLFFALLVLSAASPFYLSISQSIYMVPAIPPLAWLAYATQKRYLLKSIQLFALHERSKNDIKPKEGNES